MSKIPKISIITVVYNAHLLLEKTILSISEQTYTDIEYIIIDGGSVDGTLEIINKYKSYIDIFISEEDNGIYDAMNKGLSLSRGEYVLFLNAGDLLYENDTIEKVFSLTPNADVYFGKTAVIDSSGKFLGDRRLAPPINLNWKSFKYGMCVSHQSFIPKRLLCGEYTLDYKISSDIDWVINILKKAEFVINTNSYISKFLLGGTSKKHMKIALKERWLIMLKHYGFLQTIWSHLIILFRYPLHKLTKKTMT